MLLLLFFSLLASCQTSKPSPARTLTVLSGGWQNSEATVVRLNKIAQEFNINLNVIKNLVSTAAQAERLGMKGSPSVQINGLDIEADVRNMPASGFTWRIYSGVSGIPSRTLIIRAFKEAGWIP